jgi:CRISPR system Cascade subunit CasD
MTTYLTFTLAAPLASFGGVAVGERRATADHPMKSAILGLVAGALGIERGDDEAHIALAEDWKYAARIENLPSRSPHHSTSRRLMTDYHTAQTSKRSAKTRPATRREELQGEDIGTILTYREYRTDCSYTIALWPAVTTPRHHAEAIAAALRRPVFVPYAGRKACPLMLPMAPRIFDAATLEDAFKAHDAASKNEAKFRETHRLAATPDQLAIEAKDKQGRAGRIEKRRDTILSRKRWQFGLREEFVGRLDRGGAG